MEKYIFDQSNGLWYELQGDYYIPCLVLDEAGTSPIGMWGRKHQQYLKEHRPVLYSDLVLSGKLHSYLADISCRFIRQHALFPPFVILGAACKTVLLCLIL